jgi:hypothetical protein
MAGRDVPLVDVRDFGTPRSEGSKLDTDPIGPAEKAARAWAEKLRWLWIGLACVAQAGMLLMGMALLDAATGVTNAIAGQSAIGLDLEALSQSWLLRIGAGTAIFGFVSTPGSYLLHRWFDRLAMNGGWRGRALLAKARLIEGADADAEQIWRRALLLEGRQGGYQPDTAVRWVRAMKEPPAAELRPFLIELREHLKSGQVHAEEAIRDNNSALARTTWSGRDWETGELHGMCIRAVDALREIIAFVPAEAPATDD